MESGSGSRGSVGVSARARTTLAQIYEVCGHVYVTNQNYVHMHFYTGDKQVVDYLVNQLSVRVVPHNGISDVVISHRKHLLNAVKIIASAGVAVQRKRELTLTL